MENRLALAAPANDGAETYLAKLVGYYEEAENLSSTAREKSERDRDYYDGKQLTDDEAAALTRRGQPPIALNLIRQRVDYLLGLEKKQRGDPKGYPRNPEDQPAADAFTDGMRFVVDQADYPGHRSAAFKNVVSEGFGGVEWSVTPSGEDYVISCTHIPWDRIFYDPHAAKNDFSDARYLGQVFWLDEDEALERVAQNGGDVEAAKSLLTDTFRDSGLSQTYDDKPTRLSWCDRRRKRVRIVSMWHKDRGGWKLCEFTKAGVLWEMDGPYLMRQPGGDAETYCPLVLESCYIDRDNNRYGIIRDLIDPQDETNKRRSKALDLISRRTVIAETGAVENIEVARRELARSDGWVDKAPGFELEIISGADLAAGQAALGQQAADYILRAGANDALQGRVSPDQSGKAIEAQQAGGLIEMGELLDGLRRFDRKSFKIIAAMIQQFWTAEKWIRVTDDELSPEYVGLNVPQYTDQQTGLTATVKEWEEVVGQGHQPMLVEAPPKNNVAELDVDIIVAESPDTINNSVEGYQAMAQLFSAAPNMPPPIMRMMIEANPSLNTRLKKKLLDMIEQMSGQPDPAQALAAEQAKADTEKTRAEGFRAMAQGEAAASRAHAPMMPEQPMPQEAAYG